MAMMLEAGEKELIDSDEDVSTLLNINDDDAATEFIRESIGEWDPLKHTKKTEPVKVENKYELLYESDDDDDDDDDGEVFAKLIIIITTIDEDENGSVLHSTRRRPNQRQRRQRRLRLGHNQDVWKDEEDARDAAATKRILEDDWIGWHPGPEHCGDLQHHNVNYNGNINDYCYDDYSDSYTTHGSSTSMHTTHNQYLDDCTTPWLKCTCLHQRTRLLSVVQRQSHLHIQLPSTFVQT